MLLTDDEYLKLEAKFGKDKAEAKIKEMDEAIAMKGYKYKSHYLAILNWARNEKENPNKPTRPYMTVDEESKHFESHKKIDRKGGMVAVSDLLKRVKGG